jgi:hypothetical protein
MYVPTRWRCGCESCLTVSVLGTALPSLVCALTGAASTTITDHPSSPALTTGAIQQNVRVNVTERNKSKASRVFPKTSRRRPKPKRSVCSGTPGGRPPFTTQLHTANPPTINQCHSTESSWQTVCGCPLNTSTSSKRSYTIWKPPDRTAARWLWQVSTQDAESCGTFSKWQLGSTPMHRVQSKAPKTPKKVERSRWTGPRWLNWKRFKVDYGRSKCLRSTWMAGVGLGSLFVRVRASTPQRGGVS